jgi:hypothetical protein
MLIFTSQLSASSNTLGVQSVSSQSADARVYPSLPLLNFINLLLLAVQRGSTDLFKQLARHYASHIQDVGIWDDALAQIGELYFGVKIPKQGNPLFDMMGSMLFGGGQGGGNAKPGAQQSRKPAQKVEAPPPSMDLD